MTTHPDTPADPKDRKTADDLVERLERQAKAQEVIGESRGYTPAPALLFAEAAARIRSLEAQRDAAEARAKDYRTVAINQGWNWAMCNAYGREAYLAHRGEHVDACALNAAETRARENLDRMKEEG